MDLIWHGWENGYSAKEIGKVMDYTADEVSNIFTSFERKVRTTEYLRMLPIHYHQTGLNSGF
jgi:NAD+ synthase